ncbi:hypothetical protein HDV00_004967 [Rhizophlyctis rosea]|nr:hypothetical protein HDV00_004967 [Rhizophlyctis rosea]
MLQTLPEHIQEAICLLLPNIPPFLLSSKLIFPLRHSVAVKAAHLTNQSPTQILNGPTHFRNLLLSSEQVCIRYMRIVEPQLQQLVGRLEPLLKNTAPVHSFFPSPPRVGTDTSPYNLFMKEELPKVKADNPGIGHKDAFKMAAQNWRIFPFRLDDETRPLMPFLLLANYILIHCAERGHFHALRTYMTLPPLFNETFVKAVLYSSVIKLTATGTNSMAVRVRPGWAAAFLAFLDGGDDAALSAAKRLFAKFPGLCKIVGTVVQPCFLEGLRGVGRAGAVGFVEREVGWKIRHTEPGRLIDLEHCYGVEECGVKWFIIGAQWG